MSYIVHADNSSFFRKLMKTFLVELGLEFASFERGHDVIHEISAGAVDCVITGLELADMSGEELVKRLVAASFQTPVIVVTSNEEAAQANRLAGLGVRKIILKSGNWKEELRQVLTAG